MKKIIVLLLLTAGAMAHAQMAIGVSGGNSHFPFSELNDDDAPEDVNLQIDFWQAVIAFPLSFAGGRTVILNNVTYEVSNIEYDDPLGMVTLKIRQLYSLDFSVFLLQQLSDTWHLLAAATPGIADGSEGMVSADDISFTAMLGVKHAFGDRLSLGGGLSYRRDFGEPIPLPFLLIEWAVSRRLVFSALLPQRAAFMYSLSEALDAGIFAEVRGNQYNGDPENLGAENPLLKYSVASAGPEVRIHLSQWTHLELKGGTTLLRRFEFYDGENKVETFNLKNTWFVQGGLKIGM